MLNISLFEPRREEILETKKEKRILLVLLHKYITIHDPQNVKKKLCWNIYRNGLLLFGRFLQNWCTNPRHPVAVVTKFYTAALK